MTRVQRYRKRLERIETGDLPPMIGTYTPPPPYRAAGKTSVVARVISGGQTGVDRAALDWAIGRGVPHGGWCPRERRAEDGRIPARYELQETDSRGYVERTRRNVHAAEATLILNVGALDGGTRLTADLCKREGKPHLLLQLDADCADVVARARAWIHETCPRTLNIAGPREAKRPGVYRMALEFLLRLDLGKAI